MREYWIEQILNCQKCGLHKGRNTAVPGDWNLEARIMFVGIAPGRLGADQTGVAFTGDASGLYFRELLEKAGLKDGEADITNLVRCNPKDFRGYNRDPSDGEIRACSPYLLEEIKLVAPELLVPLGGIPTRFIFEHFGKPFYKISRHHAKVVEVDGRIVYPLYHPSFIVNKRPDAFFDYPKEKYERDFLKIAGLVKAI